MDTFTKRTENGKNISSDKKQVMRMCELNNSHFLHQLIDQPTRISNTLDLVFASDENFISDYDNIVNVALSDHNTLVLNTNIDLEESPTDEHKNIYYSKIPEYNLHEVSNEEWSDINEKFMNIDWENKFEKF